MEKDWLTLYLFLTFAVTRFHSVYTLEKRKRLWEAMIVKIAQQDTERRVPSFLSNPIPCRLLLTICTVYVNQHTSERGTAAGWWKQELNALFFNCILSLHRGFGQCLNSFPQDGLDILYMHCKKDIERRSRAVPYINGMAQSDSRISTDTESRSQLWGIRRFLPTLPGISGTSMRWLKLSRERRRLRCGIYPECCGRLRRSRALRAHHLQNCYCNDTCTLRGFPIDCDVITPWAERLLLRFYSQWVHPEMTTRSLYYFTSEWGCSVGVVEVATSVKVKRGWQPFFTLPHVPQFPRPHREPR